MATKDRSDISKMSSIKGEFKRPMSSFRNFIEKGGKFEPERDRYHLYVSYACPWAARTLIVRKLKGLDDIIRTLCRRPLMSRFRPFSPHGREWMVIRQCRRLPGNNYGLFIWLVLHQRLIYIKADPGYSGRFTVPVLWDTKNNTMVNNESSEIMRIFDTAFNDFIPADKAAIDLYPSEFRAEIYSLNDLIYTTVNDGVAKAGFAESAEAHEQAVHALFETLDQLEIRLRDKDYLIGERLTEADIRLWVTLIRFDPVYVTLFKCNIRDIRNGYPAIELWMKKLYWNNPAFKDTTFFDHIKVYYTSSYPRKIMPVGPIPHIRPL